MVDAISGSGHGKLKSKPRPLQNSIKIALNGMKLRETLAWVLIFVLLTYIALIGNGVDQHSYKTYRTVTGSERTWHGGSPVQHPGSCWCSADDYCMCTPSLAIDVVLADDERPDHVWLVKRKDTGQYATCGGFVEVDESSEHALVREVQEETGLTLVDLKVELLGVYSDPRRDARRHTASVTYIVRIPAGVKPVAGDDAKAIELVRLSDVDSLSMFADHKSILNDYAASFSADGTAEDAMVTELVPTDGVPFQRTICMRTRS